MARSRYTHSLSLALVAALYVQSDMALPSVIRRAAQRSDVIVDPNGDSREEKTLSPTYRGPSNITMLENKAQQRIALLFRGQSFRAGMDYGSGYKAYWCVNGSFEAQTRLAETHNRIAAKIVKLGMLVDTYGATYACRDGEDYADRLQEMYVPRMKAFDKLPIEGSNQGLTMAHVLRRALESGVKYDGIYILRWDYEYECALGRLNQASCFLNAQPRQLTYYWPGNPDGLLYLPGSYADKMLSFIEDGKCCKRPNNRVCNKCVSQFLTHLGEKEDSSCPAPKPALRHPPCTCTCPGCSDTVQIAADLMQFTPEAHALMLQNEFTPAALLESVSPKCVAHGGQF